jgi:hypothetical protein
MHWHILFGGSGQAAHMNNEQIGNVNHGELMDIKELIVGTFEDYWGRVDRALEGLTSEDLAWRPQAECNPISFIAWHIARVEDRFIHYFARGMEEVWVRDNWWSRFGLDAADHGVRYTLA